MTTEAEVVLVESDDEEYQKFVQNINHMTGSDSVNQIFSTFLKDSVSSKLQEKKRKHKKKHKHHKHHKDKQKEKKADHSDDKTKNPDDSRDSSDYHFNDSKFEKENHSRNKHSTEESTLPDNGFEKRTISIKPVSVEEEKKHSHHKKKKSKAEENQEQPHTLGELVNQHKVKQEARLTQKDSPNLLEDGEVRDDEAESGWTCKLDNNRVLQKMDQEIKNNMPDEDDLSNIETSWGARQKKKEESLGITKKDKRRYSEQEEANANAYDVDNKVKRKRRSTSPWKEKREERHHHAYEERKYKDEYRKEEKSSHHHHKHHHRRSRSHSHERSRSRHHRSSSRSYRDNRSSRREKRSRSRSRGKDKKVSYDKFWDNYRDEAERKRRGTSSERKRESASNFDSSKLRLIAVKNAYKRSQSGGGQSMELKPDDLRFLRAGGKTKEELVDICERIASGEHIDQVLPDGTEAEEPEIVHPFEVKPAAPINMHINSQKNFTARCADKSFLRLQFPVSSGTKHKEKEIVTGSEPVQKTTEQPLPSSVPESNPEVILKPVREEDRVFEDDLPPMFRPKVNISQAISERLRAVRKLQANPLDAAAMGMMQRAESNMSAWADSKNQPGLFTGHTGVKALSQKELSGSGVQPWVKRDTLLTAPKIEGGVGKLLLQKMGWRDGEGLGRNKDGPVDPLSMEFKIDRRGLSSVLDAAAEEAPPKSSAPSVSARQNKRIQFADKHPVSALTELCNKQRWGAASFTYIEEIGPNFRKRFKCKVVVNGVEYVPVTACAVKKQAKVEAATFALQSMGLLQVPAAANSNNANPSSSSTTA